MDLDPDNPVYRVHSTVRESYRSTRSPAIAAGKSDWAGDAGGIRTVRRRPRRWGPPLPLSPVTFPPPTPPLPSLCRSARVGTYYYYVLLLPTSAYIVGQGSVAGM